MIIKVNHDFFPTYVAQPLFGGQFPWSRGCPLNRGSTVSTRLQSKKVD